MNYEKSNFGAKCVLMYNSLGYKLQRQKNGQKIKITKRKKTFGSVKKI